MRRLIGLGLAGLLALGVIMAILVSVVQTFNPASPAATVRGVIGSEKLPFFQDAGVIKVLRDNGLTVQVDTAGWRQIASTVDLSKYDFAFPAGEPAALKIKADKKVKTTYSPFYAPMAIATFKDIAQLLIAAGLAKDNGTYISFDMKAYLDFVAKNKRWSDLPGNTANPPPRAS